MMGIRVFKLVGVLLIGIAYWGGVAHLPDLAVLAGLAILPVLTFACRFDYVWAMSLPGDLVTWTIGNLYTEAQLARDGKAPETLALYVEGVEAYHPIRGAFLAHIGGMPAIVMQPQHVDAQ